MPPQSSRTASHRASSILTNYLQINHLYVSIKNVKRGNKDEAIWVKIITSKTSPYPCKHKSPIVYTSQKLSPTTLINTSPFALQNPVIQADKK